MIDRLGPNGVGIFYGTGSGMDAAAFTAAERLQRKIGTKQRYTQLTIDGVAKPLVAELVGGFVGLNPRVDLDAVRLLVYVGINPVVSHGHTIATPEPVTFLRRLQEQAEVWVVDPRRSETAQHATGHLAARAGTDYAVFGYVARELLRDGMDEAYVAEWAIDVDRLREAVEPFTVELRVGDHRPAGGRARGVPRPPIRRAGRVAIETGTGVSMSRAANVTQWLTWVVMILTGSMNRPGGVWFHPGFVDRLDTVELPISPPEGRRGPGPDSRPDLHRYMGDYPCAGLPDEIERRQRRGVPQPRRQHGRLVPRHHEARARRSASSRRSCPSTSSTATPPSCRPTSCPVKDQLERADVTIWDFISRHLDVQYTPPVLAPIGERRSMWWVIAEIGRRLGHELFPELGPSPTDDDVLALRIARARVGFDELAAARYAQRDEERDDAWVDAHVRRLGGWRLAPQILVEQLAALGRLEVDSLVLVPRRQRRHLNAQLRYLGDRPEILVHPDDARRERRSTTARDVLRAVRARRDPRPGPHRRVRRSRPRERPPRVGRHERQRAHEQGRRRPDHRDAAATPASRSRCRPSRSVEHRPQLAPVALTPAAFASTVTSSTIASTMSQRSGTSSRHDDQPEVEGVEVALHRDVEALAVDDGRDGVVVQELGAGGVERLPGAGHVRDDQVDRHAVAAAQAGWRCAWPSAKTAGGGNWVKSVSVSAGTASKSCLASTIDSWTRRTRSSGSGSSTGSDAKIAGHPVGPPLRLLAGADRHRHHRHQRAVGKGVVVLEPGAQAAGADGHHHVVHGGAEGALDVLDGLQRHRPEREPAVRGDRRVERGAGRRQLGQRPDRLGRPSRSRPTFSTAPTGPRRPPRTWLAAATSTGLRVARPTSRAARTVSSTARPGLRTRPPSPRTIISPSEGTRSGRPRLGRRLDRVAGRIGVEHHRQQLDARGPVDGGVVHLGEHGEPAVGQALDDVALPERAPPVERAGR